MSKSPRADEVHGADGELHRDRPAPLLLGKFTSVAALIVSYLELERRVAALDARAGGKR